ncbi:MAG: rod shape-determining protein RodA [Solirubrobacteraceae bacterium]|nr:rod shape-determining protein RodA [Solirubrobacteraceae bacterium]
MIASVLRRFDPLLLLATAGLCVASVFAVRVSAHPDYAIRQAIFIAIGVGLMLAVSSVDVLRLRELKYGHYGLVIIGLILVLLFGAVTNGSRLAIVIGPIQIQWSEIGKVLFALAIAAEMVDRQRHVGEWATTARVIALTVPVLLLLMAEPDLGSALVYVTMLVLMLSVSGAPGRHLQTLTATGLAAIIAVLVVLPAVGVSVLKGYQTERLTSFLNPGTALAGPGYQQHQAMIGVGNGGRLGAGEGASQATSGFIPENQTDFIFAVIGERWGFVGAGLMLSLYALLLWRILRIMMEARSSYEAVFVSGIIGMLSFQIFENVGMNLGIMPITGVTLPLLSYGGSSVIATLIALGLVHAVHAHARIARDPRVRLSTHLS